MSIIPHLRIIAAVFALAVVLPLLGGCAGDDTKDNYKERPVEELYNDAMDLLKDESYDKAAKAFDEVERQHPYSVWATKAQLMAAYTHYEHNKFDDAINSLDRFIQLHPGHKDVAYAYYLKALCYYEQIADIGRDQKVTANALKSLQEVVDRFPASKYARDAKLKADLARDHLAGKEMAVGRWYEEQGQYLAAINRYRVVVDNYQTTTHVPEALHRLAECYETLGLQDEAQKVVAVLGYNYPGDEWYSDSYKLVKGLAPQKPDDSGWFSWLW
ncbi:outer membrane protein assembly factor BamD [Telmatospirillum sp.]|uniref:outer membrane protein assembly factor BamD n=1 Tax=Telmatospirillum sp. TaxID=2079197 RepID=UPI002842BEFC|nr:outer membrane protein assembly factor BamD [Telmatospirillum sp.]MDR3435799.1 outer membrane protein assembly factor BamD [Telmatospirillum sp.]